MMKAIPLGEKARARMEKLVHILIPEELHHKIRTQALAKRTTLKQLITDILEEAMKKGGKGS
jgi:predicted HicB family RNase H-like nuclease